MLENQNKLNKLTQAIRLAKPLTAAILLANLSLSANAIAVEQENMTKPTKKQAISKNKAEEKDETWELEVIEVTATKRKTNMMDTPLAVTALSQEMLDKQNLDNVRDIASLVPGMDIGFDTSQQAPVISMRGVRSSNVTEWGDPAVGLHTDGVYSPRPQGAMALMFDVNRVEALRGPQGTLYGRNSNAGAINIITNSPSMDELDGNIEMTFGKWNHKKYKGFINIPVSDTFAVRGSFVTETRDSYMDGHYSFLQYDQRFIREMGLTSEPYDVDYNYETELWEGPEADMLGRFNDKWWLSPQPWSRDGEGAVPQKAVKADPSKFYNNTDQYAFRLAALWAPTDDFSWQVTYEQFQDSGAGGIDGVNCEKLEGYKDDEGNIRDCSYHFAEIGGGDAYTALVNIPGHMDMTIKSIRSNISYYVNDSLELHYNFGFADQERTSWGDRDISITAWDMAIYFPKTDYESTSHELQLNYTGDNWAGILGYFNFEENNNLHGFWDDALETKTMWKQPDRGLKSQAIFAQMTYDMTDDLHLTLGARYTEDTKEDKGGANYKCTTNEEPEDIPQGQCVWYRLQYDGGYWDGIERNLIPSGHYFEPDLENIWVHKIADNSNKESWSSTNFRVGLDYDYNDDTMLYGYVADGFKSGGFDDKIIKRDGSALQIKYRPEEVITYELGVKTSLLDNKVNLSIAGFYSDYSDMQLSAPKAIESWQEEQFYPTGHPQAGDLMTIDDEDDPNFGEPDLLNRTIFGYPTQNIASSVIKGIELEFDWAPSPNGRLSGYVTWTSAKITSDFYNRFNYDPVNSVDGVTYDNQYETVDGELNELLLINQKGFNLPATPEWELNISYYHDFHLSNGGTIVPWIAVHWEDESYLTIWNVEKAAQQIDINMDQVKHYDDKRESYVTVDASIQYRSPGNKWYVEAYISNATDETVQHWGGIADSTSKGWMNEPRSYGARVGYNF
jgi:iron complex outermembrane receptor protein